MDAHDSGVLIVSHFDRHYCSKYLLSDLLLQQNQTSNSVWVNKKAGSEKQKWKTDQRMTMKEEKITAQAPKGSRRSSHAVFTTFGLLFSAWNLLWKHQAGPAAVPW